MIQALLLTLAIEAVVDSLYCRFKRKPQASILITGLCVNVLTQAGLWGILMLFPRPYLPILIGAEILILFVEGLWLAAFPGNRVNISEALRLSLLRNLASFGTGWFIPL